MTYRQHDIRKSLDRMIADNGGLLIEAYHGEAGIVQSPLDKIRIAREQARLARRDRERKARKRQAAE